MKQRKSVKSIDRLMTLRGSIKAKQVKRTRETSPIDGSLRIQPLKADMGKSFAPINTESERSSMNDDSIMSKEEIDGNRRSRSIKSPNSMLGRMNTMLASIRGKSKTLMSSQESESVSPERPLRTVLHDSAI